MKKIKLKKFLLLFCVLACVFGLTACSEIISSDEAKVSKKEKQLASVSSELEEWSVDMINYLNAASDEDVRENAENAVGIDELNGKQYIVNPDGMNVTTVEFCNSWVKSRSDLGSLKSVDSVDVEISDETGTLCTVVIDTTYEDRKCTFELVFDEDYNLEGAAINALYTTGEKMEKAVMNTVIGMVTVFIVLIFISFIISLLKYVNKIGAKKEPEEKASEGVDNAISQIVTAEENETDDLELVAVITAAIAASEGTSSDGLVVRSIKRRK